MADPIKTILDITTKLDYIKKIVQDASHVYVDLDSSIVDCVYDLYGIISNSTIKNVIQNIGRCDNFIFNEQHLSTICLYIGFFCEVALDELEPEAKHKIAACYYKISSELGNVYATNNLGHHYCTIGKYNSAIKYFNLSIERGLKNTPGLTCNHIADCYYQNYNYDEAIKYYGMALECNYSSTDSCHRIADCYFKKANYDDAIKYYEKGITMTLVHTLQHVMFHKIGHCYYGKKDYEFAIKYYEKALLPEYDNIQEICTDIGRIYYLIKNYDKALEYYEKALQNNSNGDTDLIDSLIANLHFIKGNYIDALKYFKKSCKSSLFGPENLCDSYESTFLACKNYDCLLTLYMFTKDRTKIINQLNKPDINDVGSSTIVEVINYFYEQNVDNALGDLIRKTINLKLELLDLHFKYAIKSSSYDQAKRDFNERLLKIY